MRPNLYESVYARCLRRQRLANISLIAQDQTVFPHPRSKDTAELQHVLFCQGCFTDKFVYNIAVHNCTESHSVRFAADSVLETARLVVLPFFRMPLCLSYSETASCGMPYAVSQSSLWVMLVKWRQLILCLPFIRAYSGRYLLVLPSGSLAKSDG